MKLYWCPRTRASHAAWALEEAGVPYERVHIDIADRLRWNSGCVPPAGHTATRPGPGHRSALGHGHLVVPESTETVQLVERVRLAALPA